MSQPMNVSDSAAAEKNVAEGSAAIVDKEAVSITSLIFFIYFIYLFVFLSFFSRIVTRPNSPEDAGAEAEGAAATPTTRDDVSFLISFSMLLYFLINLVCFFILVYHLPCCQ